MEDERTIVMTAMTSMGTILHKIHFNNEFVIQVKLG
jgi:hypothetical protein